jgi:hypothetical protein
LLFQLISIFIVKFAISIGYKNTKMSRKASIQGIDSPSADGINFGGLALGDAYTINVDASNPFYTTKLSGLIIASTTYTAGAQGAAGSTVFTFSGTPDLSEVMIGNFLQVNECEDIENTGQFEITATSDGSDTITVSAMHGLTNASSSGKAETLPFFHVYAMECETDTVGLAVVEGNSVGAALGQLVVGTGRVGEFNEVTIATSGLVVCKVI